MKQIITIFASIILTASAFAQAPNKMSYQAVIRNSSNNLVTNSTIGMRISILQGSVNGSSVYVETQTPTTNTNGLASIEIGGGIVVSGVFSSINWANGPFFVKTETDPTGGTNYNITGTSQLLSVPYALYAETSGSSTIGGGPVFIAPLTVYSIMGLNQTINSNINIDFDTLIGQHVNSVILYYEHLCPYGWPVYATIKCKVDVFTNGTTYEFCDHFADTQNNQVDKIYSGSSGQIILPLSANGVATFINSLINTELNVKVIGYYH